jgi:tetratricopeptide (TPR) repeat protein
MATTRLEILKEMVARNPSDSFARYGLAMEYRKQGDLEAAIAEFRTLMAVDPEYTAAYYHAGQALEVAGKASEARELYRRGIEVATRKGEAHAATELEAALELLG